MGYLILKNEKNYTSNNWALLLSFLGRSCVNSDWYNNITKKNSNTEKIFKSNKPKECTLFLMSIQECTNFKETGKFSLKKNNPKS